MCNLISDLLGHDVYQQCLSQRIRPTGTLNTDDDDIPLFGVHMAIVSMNIGKRISVAGNCALERTVANIFGHQGAVQPIFRMDDEVNAVKLQVTDWAHVCAWVAMAYPTYTPPTMPIGGNTTLSVTCRGALIVRYSWPNSIEWTEEARTATLDHTRMIALLLTACC